MKNIAIFVSGSGTNMENIIMQVKARTISGVCVALVISDKEKAPALQKAKRPGVETLFIDPKKFTSQRDYEVTIVKELRERNIDIIVLAGFMRILTSYFVDAYKDRMINVHPALLPAFKGAHGIRDSFNAGVSTAGVTIHFVTAELDSGPIIMQKSFTVSGNETLESFEKKIHEIEYEIYPQAIQLLARGRVQVKGKQVIIK